MTNIKDKPILYEPVEREIKKKIMFADMNIAQARFDFVQNFFTRALLSYDTEKAKAYKALLSDIKSLAENANEWNKFK